jgi:hypothetical protein
MRASRHDVIDDEQQNPLGATPNTELRRRLVRFVSGVPARIYFDAVLFLLAAWLPLQGFRRIPDKSAFSGSADASFRCARVAKRYDIQKQGTQDHR